MPFEVDVLSKRPHWAAPGDVNAFFGLMLDNIAGLLLAVTLLNLKYEFPTDFALTHMVPGTALGVLIGDLWFFFMALRLSKQSRREDVTAMPLGLDTPSTFGMVFFVLGDSYQAGLAEGLAVEAAAIRTWHIGICCIVFSGIFKLACAFASGWVRNMVPRAGLLGSLAAIALVLIAFIPLLDIFSSPLAGLLALTIVLLTLIARRSFLHMPGALGALLVGCMVFYILEALAGSGIDWFGAVHREQASEMRFFPTEWLSAFGFGWTRDIAHAKQYLPIVIPFALGTVIGGIDCTESASAAGDDYPTGKVIGVEAVATLVAGLCGGVIQTTPYIGHPAYKAMGGRSAYTLATALFVGGAGIIGYFGMFYAFIPKATVFPILVFIGLEITSQSYMVTPRRHYAALALACVPALASLVLLFSEKVLFDPGLLAAGANPAAISSELQGELNILRMLANGFIITSLLWASLLAAIIDGRMIRAGVFCLVCAISTAFGIIHSPLPGASLYMPLEFTDQGLAAAGPFAGATADLMRGVFWGYVASALLLIGWEIVAGKQEPTPMEH